jgi:hypothetical protein
LSPDPSLTSASVSELGTQAVPQTYFIRVSGAPNPHFDKAHSSGCTHPCLRTSVLGPWLVILAPLSIIWDLFKSLMLGLRPQRT